MTITGNEVHSVRSNHRQLLLNTKPNLELLQEFAHKQGVLHIQRHDVQDDECGGIDGGISVKVETLEAE